MRDMCTKFGQLRMADVALFLGFATALVSVIYSRRTSPSSSSQPDASTSTSTSTSTSLEPESPDEKIKSVVDKWHFPKWVKQWDQNQMPFHSPLLYRREDDDYFAYDPHLDDDGGGRSKQKKNVRFRGMFHANSYFSKYQEQLNNNGYAAVDDIIYYADDYRDSTLSALKNSEFQLNLECIDCIMEPPAFEFPNDEENHRHYVVDDDAWDAYYAFDDDIIRGTRGTGLMEAEEEKEEEEYEEEDEEEKEEEEGDNISKAETDVCTRPSFYRTYHPTCNEMHASLSGYQWLLGEEAHSRRWKKRKYWSSIKSHLSKYLGHGYYRDAFLFRPTFVSYDKKNDEPSTQWDEVVFKTMRHMYEYEGSKSEPDDDEVDLFHHRMRFDRSDKYTFLHYQDDMRKDAMVMELLSSSPRAVDIYSHCSMSSVIEFAPTDMDEYIYPTLGFTPKRVIRKGAESFDVVDQTLNDYISPEEKLEIALEMAKCIAVIHGYDDGVIVHVDVQVGQFFRGRDGLIKIVDYNRAEALLYDEENKKYCKWTNGSPGDGGLRAPEENIDAPLTEKIDVFSLGNVFYSLLTGKMVWADYDKAEKIYNIEHGIQMPIPHFYNKSPISHLLVRAIKACWTFDVEDRPSIFWLVNFLEEAVAKYPVTKEAGG